MERATNRPSAPNGCRARAAETAPHAAPAPQRPCRAEAAPSPAAAAGPTRRALRSAFRLPLARRTLLGLTVLALLAFEGVPEMAVGAELPATPAVSVLPRQDPAPAAAWEWAGFRIEPLASYEVTARVLAAKAYTSGREAAVSPLDLALGWGPMAERGVLEQLSVSQQDRWYFVRWQRPPLPVAQVIANSANTHIVPASAELAERLAAIEAGDVVRLRGYLVRVVAPDGWTWRSSLRRDDTGDGSCEVLWVEELESFSDQPIIYATQ